MVVPRRNAAAAGSKSPVAAEAVPMTVPRQVNSAAAAAAVLAVPAVVVLDSKVPEVPEALAVLAVQEAPEVPEVRVATKKRFLNAGFKKNLKKIVSRAPRNGAPWDVYYSSPRRVGVTLGKHPRTHGGRIGKVPQHRRAPKRWTMESIRTQRNIPVYVFNHGSRHERHQRSALELNPVLLMMHTIESQHVDD